MATIIGTTAADTLLGTADDDAIKGRTGDDIISAGDGADRIDGGSNNDTIFGEGGDDTITVYSLSPIEGSNPATRLGDGVSYADGGEGLDTLVLKTGTTGTGLNVRPVGYFFRALVSDVAAIHVFTNGPSESRDVADVINFEILVGSKVNDYFDLSALRTPITVRAGAGDDAIVSGTGADILHGNDGDDFIDVGRGDTAYGDAGQDVLSVSSDAQGIVPTLIHGGEGVDTLIVTLSQFASGPIDLTLRDGVVSYGTINATSIENISLNGPYGASLRLDALTIRGDDNDNIIEGSFSDGDVTGAFIDGGGGADTITLLARDSRFFGGAGDDILTSIISATDSLNNEVHGGDGDDRITNSGQIFADDGDDFINATRDSVVRGGAGNDTMFVRGEAFGDDGDDWAELQIGAFDGGAGVDTFVVGWYGSVTVDLIQGTVRTDLAADGVVVQLAGVENVIATDFADTVVGDPEANHLVGGGGHDILYGGGGNDVLEGDSVEYAVGEDQLFGMEGNDLLVGGAGHDTLDGGSGLDTADYSRASQPVTVNLTTQTATNDGYGGMDTLVSIENLVGSAFSDALHGDHKANTLSDALGGSDRFYGEGGADIIRVTRVGAGPATTVLLNGGDGDDALTFDGRSRFTDTVTLNGDDGSDRITVKGAGVVTLNAGAGDDLVVMDTLGGAYAVTLGAGSDTLKLAATNGAFMGSTANRVLDFATGDDGDVLDISAWLGGRALRNYTAGSNPFSDGHMRLVQSGTQTVLQVDRDGGADSWTNLLTFRNTQASNFVAHNLGGYAQPVVGSAAPALTMETAMFESEAVASMMAYPHLDEHQMLNPPMLEAYAF